MKILISGYYGAKNIGDELGLKSITEEIFAFFPSSQVFVLSENLAWSEKNHPRIKALKKENLYEVAKEIDLFVVGGGGLIQEYYGLSISDLFFQRGVACYALVPFLAKYYKKPLFYWAQGVGPLFTEEGKEFAKWFFSLADFISVRDKKSYALLKSFLPEKEIFLDCDPSLALDFEALASPFPLPLPDKIKVGINLRPWFSFERVVPELARALESLFYAYDKRIVFIPIPFDLKLDVEILKKFFSLLPEGSVYRYPFEELDTISEVLGVVKVCDYLIGMRLHFLIAGVKLNKPVFALSYDVKTDELVEELELLSEKIEELENKVIYHKLYEFIKGKTVLKVNTESKTGKLFKEFVEKKVKTEGEEVKKEVSPEERYIKFLKLEIESLRAKICSLERELSEKERELSEKERELSELRERVERVEAERETLHDTLSRIYNSNFWALASKYYTLRDKTPLRFIIKPLRKVIIPLLRKKKFEGKESLKESLQALEWIKEVNEKAPVSIIISAFEYSALYNQRTINFAKVLEKKGYLVIYVPWQWHPEEEIKGGVSKVSQNIWQVPLYPFLNSVEKLNCRSDKKSLFFLNFPARSLVEKIYPLREKGFNIIYDVMDDWEEFNKVGQAPWYEAFFEVKAINEADVVTTVTEALKEKFLPLREDIHVVPNGFNPVILGENNFFISAKNNSSQDEIKLGYFGHLTDAWFAWEGLFYLAEKRKDFKFEIIGYGEPFWVRERLKKYSNIDLLGKVEPEKLWKYVKDWKVALIPFKNIPLSRGVDPIKVYEYLFFGLPVCTTGVPAVKNYPMCFYAEDYEEFENLILKALKLEREKYKEEIKNFLTNALWDRRLEKILDLVKNQGLRILY